MNPDDSDAGENPDKQYEDKVMVKVPDLDENDCHKINPKNGKPMYKWVMRNATPEDLGMDPNDPDLPPPGLPKVAPVYDFDGNAGRRRALALKVINKLQGKNRVQGETTNFATKRADDNWDERFELNVGANSNKPGSKSPG